MGDKELGKRERRVGEGLGGGGGGEVYGLVGKSSAYDYEVGICGYYCKQGWLNLVHTTVLQSVTRAYIFVMVNK